MAFFTVFFPICGPVKLISDDGIRLDYVYSEQKFSDDLSHCDLAVFADVTDIDGRRQTLRYDFPIDNPQRLQDALRVARIWQEEHQGLEEMSADDLEEEQNCISDAAEHWEELGMTGGVLYVEGEPVATTMASFLSTDTLDFHFDKAVGPFAAAGATVVSRRHLAASGIGRDRPFFNLEEDVNIPGLRQSKETYRPVLKLLKYFGGKPC